MRRKLPANFPHVKLTRFWWAMSPVLHTNWLVAGLKVSPIQNLSEFVYPSDLSLSASSVIVEWEGSAKIVPFLLHSSFAFSQVVLVLSMWYSVPMIKPSESEKKKPKSLVKLLIKVHINKILTTPTTPTYIIDTANAITNSVIVTSTKTKQDRYHLQPDRLSWILNPNAVHVDYGFQSLAVFPWAELQIPKPEDSGFHEQKFPRFLNPYNLSKGEQKTMAV